MSEIRIGVIGSGFMGRTHVDAADKLESTIPVAVTSGSRAEKLASDYGIDHEPDVQSLVNRDDIDAVVISTPHWLHHEEAMAAANAGKHVLVEKPMATSLEHCDQMISACKDRGLTLSVGYHQRFRESNYTTRNLIQAGEIGPVRCIQMSALFDITALRSDPGFGGNWGWWTNPLAMAHLMNSAPHNIDLLRWWLGSDIVNVSAQCGTYREENPNENTTMALLKFDSDAMSTYWSSSVLPSPGFPGEEFRFPHHGRIWNHRFESVWSVEYQPRRKDGNRVRTTESRARRGGLSVCHAENAGVLRPDSGIREFNQRYARRRRHG